MFAHLQKNRASLLITIQQIIIQLQFPFSLHPTGRHEKMISLGSSRRPHVFLAIVLSLALVLFLHAHPHPQSYFLSGPISKLKVQFGLYNASDGLEKKDKRIRERVERMKGYCEVEDAFEREYGRTNLRLARGYEGKSMQLTAITTNVLQALMKECAYCFKRSCEVNRSPSLL